MMLTDSTLIQPILVSAGLAAGLVCVRRMWRGVAPRTEDALPLVRSFASLYGLLLTGLLLGRCLFRAAEIPAALGAPAPETVDLAPMLRALAQPVRHVSFPAVVHTLTGRRIARFDPGLDSALLLRLQRAFAAAATRAREEGIRAKRPNEAGNAIEAYVKQGLREEGFSADVPRTATGRRQAVGYPDVEVKDADGRTIYLEVKTYSRRTANTTQRSFYFSPTAHSKILVDANHLLVAFELARERDAEGQVFRPTAWKLTDLSSLRVSLKYEFNASNRDLYGEGRVLASGSVSE